MNQIKESKDLNITKITKVIDEKYLDDIRKGNFYYDRKRKIPYKPLGYWLSINNGWEDWCKSEMPHWLENTKSINIEIEPNSKIFVIDKPNDILQTWKEYLYETKFPSFDEDGNTLMCFHSKDFLETCDFWDWFVEKYNVDGIYLTNQGQITTGNTFMYGWDCECMVIFNTNVLRLRE